MTGSTFSQGPQYVTFRYVNEPSVIRYTLDGSRPNASSTLWDSSGPREPGQVFYVTSNTTFRWMATDIKGNVSFGIQEFIIGTP
jgi:Chitobiase/beta-hexosaminidase C-terminal domain